MFNLYVVLALVASLVGSHGYAYWAGKSRAEDQCQTAALEARIATMTADREVGRKLAIEEGVISDEISADDLKMEQVIDAYKAKLAKRDDGDVCRLTADDLDSVRGPARP